MGRTEITKLLEIAALVSSAKNRLEPARLVTKQHNDRGENLSEELSVHVEVSLDEALAALEGAMERLAHLCSQGTRHAKQHPWPGGWPERDPLGDYEE